MTSTRRHPGQISWDPKIGKQFRGHSAVNHAIEEYVRGGAHVNNAENYFSIFKRGINGIYSTVKSLNIQIKEGTSFNIHHWSIFISDIGHNDPDAPCEFDIKMG